VRKTVFFIAQTFLSGWMTMVLVMFFPSCPSCHGGEMTMGQFIGTLFVLFFSVTTMIGCVATAINFYQEILNKEGGI